MPLKEVQNKPTQCSNPNSEIQVPLKERQESMISKCDSSSRASWDKPLNEFSCTPTEELSESESEKENLQKGVTMVTISDTARPQRTGKYLNAKESMYLKEQRRCYTLIWKVLRDVQ